MLEVVWSAQREHDQACPGLSNYDGPSHLLTAILNRERPAKYDVARIAPDPVRQWPAGQAPKALTAKMRARVAKSLRKGYTIRYVAYKLSVSQRQVRNVRREECEQGWSGV